MWFHADGHSHDRRVELHHPGADDALVSKLFSTCCLPIRCALTLNRMRSPVPSHAPCARINCRVCLLRAYRPLLRPVTAHGLTHMWVSASRLHRVCTLVCASECPGVVTHQDMYRHFLLTLSPPIALVLVVAAAHARPLRS